MRLPDVNRSRQTLHDLNRILSDGDLVLPLRVWNALRDANEAILDHFVFYDGWVQEEYKKGNPSEPPPSS